MPTVSSASPSVASWSARVIPVVEAALPGSPSASIVGDEDVVQNGLGRGRLASSDCTGVRPAAAAGTTNAPRPSPARATTTMSVMPSPASTASFATGEGPATVGRLGRHGDVVQRPGPRVVGQRHRPGDGAGGHTREEALLLLERPDLADHRDELGHRGQERPGCHGATQLLDDDGRLEDGQPDAAELLGDGEGGPVEGDHGPPQLLGGLAGLDDGPHQVDGALLLKEGTHRVTQLFLLSRELELHRTPSPAVPVASPTLPAAPVGGRRSGRVYLTPMSASAACVSFTPPRFLGRTWLGVPRGVAGPRRKPGPAAGGLAPMWSLTPKVARLHSAVRL